MGRAPVRPAITTLAVGFPPLLLALAIIAFVTLAAAGIHPLWPSSDWSLPEAAITANDAAIVRLVLAGADPNARSRVRAPLVSGDIELTPLEAAIGSQEQRTLRTILKYGAALDGDSARNAVCLAHLRAPHLVPILQAHGAPAVDPRACGSEQP